MSGREETECVPTVAGGEKVIKIKYPTIPQQLQAEVHSLCPRVHYAFLVMC